MKTVFWVVVAIAVGGAAWMLFGRGEPERTNDNTDNEQTSPSPTPAPNPNSSSGNSDSEESDEIPEGNVWYGELKLSNDPQRGNLMIQVLDSDRVIYINSARDWSALIGKEVAVYYEGDQDGFSLIDIKPYVRLN